MRQETVNVSDNGLSHDDVQRIIELVDASTHFVEFHLKYGGIEIDLFKPGAMPSAPLTASEAAQPAAPAPLTASEPAQPAAPAPATPVTPVAPARAVAVKAPMVGTCYRASEPGATPFVMVGQRVTRDSVVCIIEVMKLMNSVAAGTDGVVVQVLVGDGEPVEYGQALLIIDPHA